MSPSAFQLLRRVLVCLVLVTGVLAVAAMMAPQEAVAAPCCDFCDLRLQRCLNNCGGDPACEASCEASANSCFSHCFTC